MAREVVDAWIPVEYADTAIQRPARLSAIESTLTPLPMTTNSKSFPRSGVAAVGVMAKGTAYAEDGGTNDSVLLTARKLGVAFRLADEDLEDSAENIIDTKKAEFAISYSKFLDNACLGTTAVANGTTVPFQSVYKAVRTTDASTGYTADTNYIPTAGTGAVPTYDQLSALLALAEGSDWYDPASMVAYADPKFLQYVRGVKDSQSRPIFQEGSAMTVPTLFGHPLKLTQGAKATATAQYTPVGNPLLVLANSNYLMFGNRSGVEGKINDQVGALTDETLLLMRARKAFQVAIPAACAVLEVLP